MSFWRWSRLRSRQVWPSQTAQAPTVLATHLATSYILACTQAEEEKQTEGCILLLTFLKGRTQKTEQFREVNVLRLATSGSYETIFIVTIET